MMDTRDMPIAGDYAWQEAANARKIAEGSAEADAASRAELERQVFVLRGQVAFLSEHLLDLAEKVMPLNYKGESVRMLMKIKENNW